MQCLKTKKSEVYNLNLVVRSRHVYLRVNRVSIVLYLQLVSGLVRVRLLFESYHPQFGIILNMDHIVCRIAEWLKLAVELFLITAPRVPVRTYQIVTMSSIRIVEHVLCFLYLTKMTDPDSNPRSKFYYPNSPFLYRHCF